MYGLPFYGVGVAPTAIPGSPPGVPPKGATSVVSPTDGAARERPGQRPALGRVLAHADLHARHRPEGQPLRERRPGDDRQLPADRAARLAARHAPRPGRALPVRRVARVGARRANFNAAFSTPTIDLGSLSPETVFADASFPSKLTTLVTTKIGSTRTSRSSTSRPASSSPTLQPQPVDRHDAALHEDRRPRLLQHEREARPDGDRGRLGDALRLERRLRRQRPGRRARARALPRRERAGERLDQVEAGGARRTAGRARAGRAAHRSSATNIEWLVQALTAQGNVATSSNKARYFDAAPAPDRQRGIQIERHRSPRARPATSPRPVNVTRHRPGRRGTWCAASTARRRPATQPARLRRTGDGLHIIEFTGSDGSTSDPRVRDRHARRRSRR